MVLSLLNYCHCGSFNSIIAFVTRGDIFFTSIEVGEGTVVQLRVAVRMLTEVTDETFRMILSPEALNGPGKLLASRFGVMDLWNAIKASSPKVRVFGGCASRCRRLFVLPHAINTPHELECDKLQKDLARLPQKMPR